jgi:tetrahydromethanopterin S-methyltransferase subunit B
MCRPDIAAEKANDQLLIQVALLAENVASLASSVQALATSIDTPKMNIAEHPKEKQVQDDGVANKETGKFSDNLCFLGAFIGHGIWVQRSDHDTDESFAKIMVTVGNRLNSTDPLGRIFGDITKAELTNALYDFKGVESGGGISKADWPETTEALGKVLANFAKSRGIL